MERATSRRQEGEQGWVFRRGLGLKDRNTIWFAKEWDQHGGCHMRSSVVGTKHLQSICLMNCLLNAHLSFHMQAFDRSRITRDKA